MKKLLLCILLITLGGITLLGCNTAKEDDETTRTQATAPDGKPVSAEEIKNAPKAAGAFDGVPGGPMMKKHK
jgi:uncharacterized lipoprotein NlpE involved in copper resistance